MAEDKEQPKEEQAEGKKKGLPAIVLICVGAALGGAGVVVMTPAPPVHVEKEEPKIELFEHPDKMEFTFNPQAERGYKSAIVSFVFVYKADRKDVEGDGHAEASGEGGGHGGGGEEAAGEDLPPVLAAIKKHWNRARSRAFEILSNQSAETLNSPEGKRHLKALLIEALTDAFFPDGIATVHDIYWEKIFVQ